MSESTVNWRARFLLSWGILLLAICIVNVFVIGAARGANWSVVCFYAAMFSGVFGSALTFEAGRETGRAQQ